MCSNRQPTAAITRFKTQHPTPTNMPHPFPPCRVLQGTTTCGCLEWKGCRKLKTLSALSAVLEVMRNNTTPYSAHTFGGSDLPVNTIPVPGFHAELDSSPRLWSSQLKTAFWCHTTDTIIAASAPQQCWPSTHAGWRGPAPTNHRSTFHTVYAPIHGRTPLRRQTIPVVGVALATHCATCWTHMYALCNRQRAGAHNSGG